MRRLEFKLQLAALFHSQPEASQSLNSNGHSSSFDPLNSRGKILVIRGGAIGDFILTLPAIAALRQQFPQAHLEILGYPHIAQLAQIGGLVNRVQSIEARALAGFFARGGELAGDLAGYFSGFNIIVSYLYDPDEIFRTTWRVVRGRYSSSVRIVRMKPGRSTRRKFFSSRWNASLFSTRIMCRDLTWDRLPAGRFLRKQSSN